MHAINGWSGSSCGMVSTSLAWGTFMFRAEHAASRHDRTSLASKAMWLIVLASVDRTVDRQA